jgi:hypothetical protein
MTVTKCIVCIIAVAALCGCSSISVHTDYDTTADYTGYKTWDWLPVEPGEPSQPMDPRLQNPKGKARVKELIEQELIARGFDKAPDDPDFYVNFNAALGEELNVRNIENYYEYLNYTVFSPYITTRYTETIDIGTLMVDFFDAKSHAQIWRGTASTEYNYQAGPKENDPIIKEAVQKIIRRFPPK